MNSLEEYARRWTKSEGEKLDTLSEWVKSIQKVSKTRIHHLSDKMLTAYFSMFKNPEVVNKLSRLHGNFVQVPVITMASFVKIKIMNGFLMNCDLPTSENPIGFLNGIKIITKIYCWFR
jgi:hypothetical protein